MADAVFDKDAVLKLLKKSGASGEAFPFAFGLAAKAEECGLMIDLRKPGKALRGILKKQASLKKTCCGTLRVVDGEVLLQPEKPLKGIVKQLRKRFRNEGLMKYTPVLIGEDGAVIDEDMLPDDQAEDEAEGAEAAPGLSPATPEVPTQSPEAEGAPDDAALKQRLNACARKLKGLGRSDIVGRLAVELKQCAKLLEAGDHSGCATRLAKIEQVIGKLQMDGAGGGADAPGNAYDAAGFRQQLAQVAAELRELPGESVAPLAATLRALAAEAKQGGDPGPILDRLAALREKVAAVRADAATSDESAADDALPDLMAIWRAAKEDADEGIAALQTSLRAAGHPVLSRIADAGLPGVSEGNQAALMKALFDWKLASGSSRADAQKALLAQVTAYAKFLDSSPVLDMIEANPFGVSVPLRGRLKSALREIAVAARAA